MFDDLDSSLAALVAAVPTAQLPRLAGADVSFVTPDRSFAPGLATVDLFLHRIRENAVLREVEPMTDDGGRTVVLRRPPMRADCGYLVTAWAATNAGANRVRDEHRLLGEALSWFSAFPTLPPRYRRGTLAAAGHPPPAVVARLEPERDLGEFWTAMGIAPRPAFHLTVTVEVPMPVLPATGDDPVRSVVGGAVPFGGPPDDPGRPARIAGRVLDRGGGRTVPGAVVDLTGLGLRARSTEDGAYGFARVPPGEHDLRVTAPGYEVGHGTLTVPDPGGGYDVVLVPA